MRAHTITTPRPAVLLSLLALGALGLLVGGGGGQSAAAIPAATGTQAITTLETTITKAPTATPGLASQGRDLRVHRQPAGRDLRVRLATTCGERGHPRSGPVNHSARAHHPSG